MYYTDAVEPLAVPHKPSRNIATPWKSSKNGVEKSGKSMKNTGNKRINH